MTFFLALSPVLLIFVLVVFFRMDVFRLALVSFFYTAAVAWLFFSTPLKVLVLASLDGLVTTLPLLLVVYSGILISIFLLDKGSLQRLTATLSGGVEGDFRRALLLAGGLGNFFEGAGVIAEPVVAPMLYSAGISPTGSAVLSILGYAGLMHLALAGVIVTVLANVTALPPGELALTLALLSFPATFFFFLAIPLFIGDPGALKGQVPVIFALSLVMVAVAYLTVKLVGYSLSAMLGGVAGMLFLFGVFRARVSLTREGVKDMVPFLFLLVALASINLVPPLKALFAREWAFRVKVIPIHIITLRPLADAYIYLFLAFLISFRLFSQEGDRVGAYLRAAWVRGFRPLVSMALFGAVGSMIAFSGLKADLSSLVLSRNMAHALAQGLVSSTGPFYPLFAPVLGWLGTFLTGYGVASIMLFGKLQLATAQMLGVSKGLLVSSLTVGASVGSISSPFKIAIAAPLCHAVGREGGDPKVVHSRGACCLLFGGGVQLWTRPFRGITLTPLVPFPRFPL